MNSTSLYAPMLQLNPDRSNGMVIAHQLRRIQLVDNDSGLNLENLMIKVQAERCKSSFRQIFDHYYGKILSYNLKNGIESQKARELAQQVLVAVWQKAHLFDPNMGSFQTWIYTIARNQRFDYLRSKKSQDHILNAKEIFEQTQDQSQELESLFTNQEIHDHINALPLEQKEAVEGIYFEGYSHTEFSELKKIPLGTVKSRIRLALSQLKKVMEEK